MGVSLSKGGNVSLTKEAPGLSAVTAGRGWDVRTSTGADFDLDASAIMLAGTGKVASDAHFVFFNNLQSPDGSVEHTGDNLTSGVTFDPASNTVTFSVYNRQQGRSYVMQASPTKFSGAVASFVVERTGLDYDKGNQQATIPHLTPFTDVGFSNMETSTSPPGAQGATYSPLGNSDYGHYSMQDPSGPTISTVATESTASQDAFSVHWQGCGTTYRRQF